jgi:hypothetical protein
MKASSKKQITEDQRLELLKDEIIKNNKDPEIRFIRINILNGVGPGAYKAYFEDRKIYIRSGWYVIPVDNEWMKSHLTKLYSNVLKKNKIILQIGD